MKHLEADNQRLLEEIRSKRFITDSIYATAYNRYTTIDSFGKTLTLKSKYLPSGYYLISEYFDMLHKAQASLASTRFAPLSVRYVLIGMLIFKLQVL